jgi:hypothetical protein
MRSVPADYGCSPLLSQAKQPDIISMMILELYQILSSAQTALNGGSPSTWAAHLLDTVADDAASLEERLLAAEQKAAVLVDATLRTPRGLSEKHPGVHRRLMRAKGARLAAHHCRRS